MVFKNALAGMTSAAHRRAHTEVSVTAVGDTELSVTAVGELVLTQ